MDNSYIWLFLVFENIDKMFIAIQILIIFMYFNKKEVTLEKYPMIP